jgi:hypothetical protein
MNEVVAGINANNDRIRTLYMTHKFGAKLVEMTKDGKRRETNIDGDGVIMYQAPDNLYMNGRHPLVGKLFTLGCNPREYWLAVAQEKVDAIWFGQMASMSASRASPTCRSGRTCCAKCSASRRSTRTSSASRRR